MTRQRHSRIGVCLRSTLPLMSSAIVELSPSLRRWSTRLPSLVTITTKSYLGLPQLPPFQPSGIPRLPPAYLLQSAMRIVSDAHAVTAVMASTHDSHRTLLITPSPGGRAF